MPLSLSMATMMLVLEMAMMTIRVSIRTSWSFPSHPRKVMLPVPSFIFPLSGMAHLTCKYDPVITLLETMKMILTKRIWQYLISTRGRFWFFVRCPNEVDKNPDSRLKEKSCQCLLTHSKCKSFPDISDFVWLSFDPQTCLRNLRIIFWFLQSGDFWADRIFLRPFRWPVFRARLWHGWVGCGEDLFSKGWWRQQCGGQPAQLA